MQPSFNPPANGYNAELLCPSCGGNYQHHHRIEVFERNEDQETGVRVIVENGGATIDQNLTGNPSARRHGLNIHFDCELCHTKSVLTIAQHKGNTYVDFSPIQT